MYFGLASNVQYKFTFNKDNIRNSLTKTHRYILTILAIKGLPLFYSRIIVCPIIRCRIRQLINHLFAVGQTVEICTKMHHIRFS